MNIPLHVACSKLSRPTHATAPGAEQHLQNIDDGAIAFVVSTLVVMLIALFMIVFMMARPPESTQRTVIADPATTR